MNAWEQLVGMVERQTTEDIQPVDIADATWLAAHWEQSSASVDFVRSASKMDSPKPRPVSNLTQEPKDLNPQKHTSGFADTDVSSKRSTDDPPAFDDYNLDLRLKAQGTGEPIICPAPPALSDADKISRALGAFNQRVPSCFCFIIDERATADVIAEENIWNPVLHPEPERRFGVALACGGKKHRNELLAKCDNKAKTTAHTHKGGFEFGLC
ncbi:MAG: hypothetical protein GY862_05165 [Gammaproteobacteria bacterium]|nr:hypothetical protein [Gammaproteobacteria bacterium]